VTRQQTNIRLSAHIRERLAKKAADEGRTLSEVIREYITRGLREDGGPITVEPVEPKACAG